jgi:hypothetical protein
MNANADMESDATDSIPKDTLVIAKSKDNYDLKTIVLYKNEDKKYTIGKIKDIKTDLSLTQYTMGVAINQEFEETVTNTAVVAECVMYNANFFKFITMLTGMTGIVGFILLPLLLLVILVMILVAQLTGNYGEEEVAPTNLKHRTKKASLKDNFGNNSTAKKMPNKVKIATAPENPLKNKIPLPHQLVKEAKEGASTGGVTGRGSTVVVKGAVITESEPVKIKLTEDITISKVAPPVKSIENTEKPIAPVLPFKVKINYDDEPIAPVEITAPVEILPDKKIIQLKENETEIKVIEPDKTEKLVKIVEKKDTIENTQMLKPPYIRVTEDEIPETPIQPQVPIITQQVSIQPQAPVQPKPQAPIQPKPQAPIQPKPQVPIQPKPQVPVQPKPQAPIQPKPQVPIQPKPQETNSVKDIQNADSFTDLLKFVEDLEKDL